MYFSRMQADERNPSTIAQSAAPIWRRPVLFPDVYVWFVFLGAMDIILTSIILSPLFRGYEVNVLARWVMENGGLVGTVAYKFGAVMLVIVICEVIGRRRLETGRRLAEWAVAISIIPVLVAFLQMLVDVGAWVFGGSE